MGLKPNHTVKFLYIVSSICFCNQERSEKRRVVKEGEIPFSYQLFLVVFNGVELLLLLHVGKLPKFEG